MELINKLIDAFKEEIDKKLEELIKAIQNTNNRFTKEIESMKWCQTDVLEIKNSVKYLRSRSTQ